MKALFDPALLALRRARWRDNSVLLHTARDEALERLSAIDRPRADVLLLDLGHPIAPAPSSLDAVVATQGLETLDQLPALLMALRHALRPDRPLVGNVIGGDSFPRLRRALIEADRELGRPASPRAHPRIDAATLAALLQAAGFVMPVVDVERANYSYASLDRLVGDLRDAALTNVLVDRPRGFPGQAWRSALARHFMAGADFRGRVEERVEFLHFVAWSPPAPAMQ